MLVAPRHTRLHRSTTCAGASVIGLVACLLLGTPPAHAQDAATLAPPDTRLYVEFNNMAAWRNDTRDHPAAALVEHRIAGLLDSKRNKAWAELVKAMELSSSDLFDRYFGRQVVLVNQQGGKSPWALVLKVTKDESDRLVDRAAKLGLKQLKKTAGFDVLATSDELSLVAVRREAIVLAAAKYSDYVSDVLQGMDDRKSLHADRAFQRFLLRIPDGKRMAFAYYRPTDSQQHAVSVTRSDRRIAGDYVARFAEGFAIARTNVDDAEPFPAPPSLVAKLQWNAPLPEAMSNRMLMMLLAMGDFREKVVPRLAPPAMVMVGVVPLDVDDVKSKATVPALGIAFRLKDDSAHRDLDDFIGARIRFYNTFRTARGQPPITVTRKVSGKTVYHAIDVSGCAPINDLPEYMRLAVRPAVGRIGDWYLLTSNETLMQQCIDIMTEQNRSDQSSETLSNPAKTSTDSTALKPKPRYLLTAEFSPARASKMLQSWVDDKPLREKNKQPPLTELLGVGATSEKMLNMVIDTLERYPAIRLHTWEEQDADDDAQILHARLTVDIATGEK